MKINSEAVWDPTFIPKCATCWHTVRGANTRTHCILTQSILTGNIPAWVTLLWWGTNPQIYPTMVRRIVHGMDFPIEENACSRHTVYESEEQEMAQDKALSQWHHKPISDWKLSNNLTRVLIKEWITLQILVDMGEKETQKRIRRMWPKSTSEIRAFLSRIGVNWKE